MSVLSPQLFVVISVAIIFTSLVVGKAFFLLLKKVLRISDPLSDFDVIEKFNFFMISGFSAMFLIASILTPFALFSTEVILLIILCSFALLLVDSRKLTNKNRLLLLLNGRSLVKFIFVLFMVGIITSILVSPFMWRIGPVGGDCKTHLLVIRLILENNRLPLTLQPYWDLPTNYLLGSHVPVAFVEAIFGFELAKVFTVATLFFSVLAIFSLYNFCRRVLSNEIAALFSIFLMTTALYPLDNMSFMNISFIFGFYVTPVVLALTTYLIKNGKINDCMFAIPLVGYIFTTHPVWIVVSLIYFLILLGYFITTRTLKKRDLFIKYIVIISLSILYSAFSFYQLVYFQQPLESNVFISYDPEFKIQQLLNLGQTMLPSNNMNSFFFGEWGLQRYSAFLPFILVGISIFSFFRFFLSRHNFSHTLARIKSQLHWVVILLLWYFLLLLLLENNPAGLYFFHNALITTALPPHRLYASMQIPIFLLCSFVLSLTLNWFFAFITKMKLILQLDNKRYDITRFFSKVLLIFSIIAILFASYLFAYQPLYSHYERRIDLYDVFAESDYQLMKWMEKHLPRTSLILSSTLDCSQYIPALANHPTLILEPNNPQRRTEQVRRLTQYLITQPNNIETVQLLRQYDVDYIFIGSESFSWVREFSMTPEKFLYYPSLTNEQELVSYWIFKGNEAIDLNGKNNGLIRGSAYAEDISAKLNFDGTEGYVNIPHSSSLDISSDMTIEAWISITDYQDFRIIVSKWGSENRNYYLAVWRDTGQLTFIRNGLDGVPYTVKSDQPLSTETWHHIIAVSRGKMLELYIDGLLVGSGSWYGKSETGSQEVHIGHNSAVGVGRQHYKGAISNLAIYNRALSVQEITDLFQQGDPISIPESPYYKIAKRIENTYLISIVYPNEIE